jgi:outer membrane protein OmpA-like peptidoglycan-associated protein
MTMRLGTSTLLLTAVLFSTGAYAEPVRKADDIIKFFSNQAQLGASRAICVGTEDECKSKAAAAAAPAEKSGLDMLVNFDLNSAQLTPDARAKLTEFSKALKDNRLSALNFVVEGYTDASGTQQYNQGLSQRRAESVETFLLANGIESTRLSAVGLGQTHPRVPDAYDPVNRRVEMRIKAQ